MNIYVKTTLLGMLAVLEALMLLSILSHASGTVPNRRNSLGISEVYNNSNTYLLALPIAGQEVEGGYNIRFWPYNTPSLYDETVFFCDIGDKFDGKTGPLVIVYETRAHQAHSGIGCHELRAVFQTK